MNESIFKNLFNQTQSTSQNTEFIIMINNTIIFVCNPCLVVQIFDYLTSARKYVCQNMLKIFAGVSDVIYLFHLHDLCDCVKNLWQN